MRPEQDDYPSVLYLDRDANRPGIENLWHADATWRMEPALGGVLRMLEGPAIGGDTLFADMHAAYDGLPQRIKNCLDGRVARHNFSAFYQKDPQRFRTTEEELEEINAAYPPIEHPVIRTHPETGRKGIFVNALFTEEIVGMDAEESRELLDILYRQATVPEYQFRFRWTRNSIVLWDNRSCHHYAVSDYWPHVRRLERVMISGDAPYFDPDQAPPTDPEPPFRGHLQLWSES